MSHTINNTSNTTLRLRSWAGRGALGLTAVIALSGTAWAQPATSTPSTMTPAATAGANANANASGMQRADSGMLRDIAHANLAEIETGKLAMEKAGDAKLKEFAKMMVDDHTKALGEVQQLAQSKNVTLPTEPDLKHKAAMTKLKVMSGGMFDKSYIKNAGVADHVATEKLLKKTQSSAKDADVKALASKMLPVVQAHLKHAQELDRATK
jgi:putative membrane protein